MRNKRKSGCFRILVPVAAALALLAFLAPLEAADEVLLVGGAKKTGEIRSVPEGVAVKLGKKEEIFSCPRPSS